MRIRKYIALGAVVLVSVWAGIVPSHAEESICDPDNGHYACDGTDDQGRERPTVPSTGV